MNDCGTLHPKVCCKEHVVQATVGKTTLIKQATVGKTTLIKGDDGFSPTITVAEDTATSYKLEITDANGAFVTPNLKGGGSADIKAGDNIDITDNVISVLTTNDAEHDNTRPITSAGVNTIVGNIDILLKTI